MLTQVRDDYISKIQTSESKSNLNNKRRTE